MAAAITTVAGILERLAGGAIGRITEGILAGVGVGELVNFLEGNPSTKSKIAQFAIVDLHNKGQIVKLLSKHRVYVILTARRHRTSRVRVIRERGHSSADGPVVEVIR